ncbi:MAG: hypothetical protein IT438_07840 [Phycisphaerales bacterium]|nr:hypothetical protein [Phycisphaerales bacterium]
MRNRARRAGRGGLGDRVAVAPDDQTSTGRELLGWDIAPLCCCDLGYSGTTTAQDVFDFLAMFFGSAADFNNDGATTAQDIFDFLTCWFGGCV